MVQQKLEKSFGTITLFIVLGVVIIFNLASANTPDLEEAHPENYDAYVQKYLQLVFKQAELYYIDNDTYSGAFESIVFSDSKYTIDLPKNVIMKMGKVTTTSYIFSARHTTDSKTNIYCVSDGKGVFKASGKNCMYEKVVCYDFNTATKEFLGEVAIRAEMYYLDNRTYEGAFDNILQYGSNYHVTVPANVTLTREQVGDEAIYFYSAKHSDPTASTFYVSPATGVYKDASKGC